MTTLLSFLFVIGVLVFVHELGHFAAARRIGVRVLTFSLGFGPKLLAVRRGDTEYCISAIPLGGYVKMAGDSPGSTREGQPHEFLSRSKWERFQILAAGPAMNIALAIVLWSVVFAQETQVPAYLQAPPVVAAVLPGSPAAEAGIRPGDRILEIGGRAIDTWERLAVETVTRRAGRPLPLLLVRDGRTIDVRATPAADGMGSSIGVLPDLRGPIVVQAVEPDAPAARAGVQAGDVLLEVEGDRIVHHAQLAAAIERGLDREVHLTVRRGDETLRLAGVPEMRDGGAVLGLSYEVRPQMQSVHPGPLEAAGMAVARSTEVSGLILRLIGGLLTGDTSVRQFSGPVTIAVISGESARAGWVALLSLMALISLNLGILNLMPVPVLDGGHILIMALEGVARRDFSIRVKERMLLGGVVVLLLLMVTVIYNDLAQIVRR